jgi:hypothetical protein
MREVWGGVLQTSAASEVIPIANDDVAGLLLCAAVSGEEDDDVVLHFNREAVRGLGGLKLGR